MEDRYKLYEGYAKKANECRLNEFDHTQIEGNQVARVRQEGALAARGWVMYDSFADR